MVRSLQSKLKSSRSTETAVAALLADPMTAGRTPLSSPFLAEQWNFTLHHHQLLSSALFVGHTARLKQVGSCLPLPCVCDMCSVGLAL